MEEEESLLVLRSGYADDRVFRRRVVEAGESFIPKPFRPTLLAERILNVLEYQGESARQPG